MLCLCCSGTARRRGHSPVLRLLQLQSDLVSASDRASKLAEENESLVAKLQRLIPPPERAGGELMSPAPHGRGLSSGGERSPTKVHHV